VKTKLRCKVNEQSNAPKTIGRLSGVFELLSLTHIEFLINLKGSFMYSGGQFFGLILLVIVKENLFK
jgi:hypothetical protein